MGANPENGPPAGPLCAELRSKKYYFLEGPPRSAEDLLDGSNDCWCARTAERVGPDDGIVHPEDCRPGRPCFRSPAATIA